MVSQTEAHCRIDVCTWPTLTGAKRFNNISYSFYASHVHIAHTFISPHRGNSDETRIPNQLTNNYCICSPSYKSVE